MPDRTAHAAAAHSSLAQRLRALSAEAADHFDLLVLCDEVPSTNDLGKQLAGSLLPPGSASSLVVVARRQSRGRGRLGRTWESPPGGLYLSVVRRMTEGTAAAAGQSLLAGVALCRAVEDECGACAELKWPNDLLVRGRKLAGILVEAGEEAARDGAARDGGEGKARGEAGGQVIGVGLNVNTRRADLPEELRAGATTLLEETGREQSVDGLAARFLCHLYRLQKRFAVEKALPLDEYQGRLALTGRMVSVALGARTLTGRVKGIAGDGALVLDCGGNAVEVISGEVTHVREEEDGFAAGS